MSDKQYSEACERNQEPILSILQVEFAANKHVLEIGSGTGQHAVFFATHLRHLTWQTSDLPVNHPSIVAWQQEVQLPNLQPPLALNVAGKWPHMSFDGVFTANTCHIMAWHEVEAMFAGIGQVLCANGKLCIYGPFNYGGRFTSASNTRFDAYLKAQATHMGIRNVEDIQDLAAGQNMAKVADYEMPANNRLLVWQKQE